MTNGSDADVGVRAGDVIAGKYRVERVLGAGGMGIVLAAQHLQLDERVAIKLLLPDAMKNPEAVTRFEREARAAVKIKSEHIARVIDVGKLETGAPYMVMEFLEGGDLDAWLRQRGPMDAAQAAEFVIQACEAIAEAHALGIVHRDLKPANLFCVRRADGLLSVKVLDFGISKMAVPGAVKATSTGAIFGSPLYMSPEQMRSSTDVDVRTDIWSLGVILFELVGGRPPFDGDGMPAVVLAIATADTPSLRAMRPDLPAGFERVVERCLQKAPGQRFADVAELALALGPYAPPRAQTGVERIQRTLHGAGAPESSLGRSSRAVIGAAPTQSVTAASSSWGAPVASPPRRGPVFAIAGAVVAVAAITGGVVVLTQGQAPAAHASAAAMPAPPPAPSPSTPAAPMVAPAPTAAEPPPTATASATAPPATQPSAQPPPAHTHAAATHAGAPAKPNCNPPYTFDASGTKIFKKECL